MGLLKRTLSGAAGHRRSHAGRGPRPNVLGCRCGHATPVSELEGFKKGAEAFARGHEHFPMLVRRFADRAVKVARDVLRRPRVHEGGMGGAAEKYDQGNGCVGSDHFVGLCEVDPI